MRKTPNRELLLTLQKREKEKFLNQVGRKKHNGGCEGNAVAREKLAKIREHLGKKNPHECLSFFYLAAFTCDTCPSLWSACQCRSSGQEGSS